MPRRTRTPLLLTRPRGLIATLALMALGACAPPAMPASFAAPAEGPEPPAPRIAVMLTEDPPLPGEATVGWRGLDAAGAGPGAHHHAGGAATAPPLRSEARPALTLDAAVRLALRDNRELRASLLEIGMAKGQLAQAGALPNPEFEVELTPRQEGLDDARASLALEYDLTALILAPSREHAAASAVEAARLRAAGEVVALGYAVRAAFHAVQASEQRLAIATRALDAFAAGRDAARALFDAGNVSELDAATQEAAYETARITTAEIEVELLDRREALQRLLGLSGVEPWRVEGAIPKAPPELPAAPRAEARAIAASFELAEMRSRKDGAERRAGLARTEGALPDVSIGVHGEREDAAWLVGAGLRFTLPLFDRKQGSVMSLEAERDGLVQRGDGLAIDIRSSLRQARHRLVSAHARARHHERVVVPARRRVLEQTLLQYNAMQTGVFELLQARRDLLEAELSEVETLREHWTAQAAFDAMLAGRRVDVAGGAGSARFAGAGDSAGGGH